MRSQTVQVAEIIRPYFTEEQAKEMVEKKKRFSFSKRRFDGFPPFRCISRFGWLMLRCSYGAYNQTVRYQKFIPL